MDETQHLARPGVSASASPVPSRARSCNTLLGGPQHRPDFPQVRVVFLLCPLAGMTHRAPQAVTGRGCAHCEPKAEPTPGSCPWSGSGQLDTRSRVRTLCLGLWTWGHAIPGTFPRPTHTKPGHLWEQHQLTRHSLGNRPGPSRDLVLAPASPPQASSLITTEGQGWEEKGGSPPTCGGLLVPV